MATAAGRRGRRDGLLSSKHPALSSIATCSCRPPAGAHPAREARMRSLKPLCCVALALILSGPLAAARALGAAGGAIGRAAGIAACDELPYRGLFYGNLVHGDTVSNVYVTCGAPIRQPFTAERSGPVAAVQWYLRYDRDCHGKKGCYSSGDGGQVRLALFAADGNDMPQGPPLAQTAINGGQPSLFGERRSWGGFPIWPLDRSAVLAAGERYVLVLENLGCDGHVSTNGMLAEWDEPVLRSGRAGPYYGNDRPIYRGSRIDPDHLSLFALHYADGMVVGPSTIWATGSSRERIGDEAMARQRFIVTDATRLVDGVSVWAWRNSARVGDMRVTVRRTSGETLASGVIPADAFALSRNHARGVPVRPWARAVFDAPVLLERSSRYVVELAAAGCCYETIPGQDSGPENWSPRERWASALAEFSEDGGASWRCGVTKSAPEGQCALDLPLGFTVSQTTLEDGTTLQCRAPDGG